MKGYFRTTLSWNPKAIGDLTTETTGNWILSSVLSNSSYATVMSKSGINYPIGRQEWNIYHDACNFGDNVTVNLTLTACQENMFTCDNGDCIHIDKVDYFANIKI